MRGDALSTGLRRYFFADRCQELDTASVPGAGIAPSAAEQTCSACPAIVSSEIADRSESTITERPITAPGSRWTGFWRRRAVQFPTVAKRAVAANGAAAPRGTADAPKKGFVEAASSYTTRGYPGNRCRGPTDGAVFGYRQRKLLIPRPTWPDLDNWARPVSNSAQQAKIPRESSKGLRAGSNPSKRGWIIRGMLAPSHRPSRSFCSAPDMQRRAP